MSAVRYKTTVDVVTPMQEFHETVERDSGDPHQILQAAEALLTYRLEHTMDSDHAERMQLTVERV